DFDALLRGWRNHWTFAVNAEEPFIDPDGHSTPQPRPDVLVRDQFDFDDNVTGQDGSFATAKLHQSDKIEIPLDRVEIGELFFIQMDVSSSAQNRREGETFVSAHFRDPLEPQGTSFDFSGVEPVPVPDSFPRFQPLTIAAVPPCATGPDPAAG